MRNLSLLKRVFLGQEKDRDREKISISPDIRRVTTRGQLKSLDTHGVRFKTTN